MISGINVSGQTTGSEYYPLLEKANRDKKKSIANVAIVYGANGSGKTTLAKRLEGKESASAGLIGLVRHDSNLIASGDVETHLYNERYILRNFRVDKDELGALILLGDDVDNAEKIENLSKENEKLADEIELLDEEARLLNSSAKGSVKSALAEFKSALKGAGWQDNEQLISQRGKQTNFTASKISEIIAAFRSIPKYESDAKKDCSGKFSFKAKKSELASSLERLARTVSKNTGNKQQEPLGSLEVEFEKTEIIQVMNSVPANVDGNALTQAIQTALSLPEQSSTTHQAKNLIVDGQAESCPLCFQAVKEEHRKALDIALREVFNEERKNQELQLERLKDQLAVPVPDLEESLKSILPVEVVSLYQSNQESVRNELTNVTSQLQAKIEDLELPMKVELGNLEAALRNLNESITQINKHIAGYNKTLQNFFQVKKDALDLNDLVCGYETRRELEKYVEAAERLSEVEKSKKEKELKFGTNSQKLIDLKSAQGNTTDAVILINQFLQVIFAEEERLKLSPASGGYAVSCRGTRLKPSDLSTGERNILSLAYFFASVFESISDFKQPTRHRLIILDDPLSSFDEDNRYGVLIFLKQIIDRISAKGGGQVIFFTHDARLVFNLNEAFSVSDTVSVVNHKLVGHELEPMILQNSNKYESMLKRIVNFALIGTEDSPVYGKRVDCGEEPQDPIEFDFANLKDSEIPSGNEVRQVLEAYSEFNFGKDVSSVTKDANLRAVLEIEDKDFSNYLRGSISKLILHGESHTENSVKAGDFDFTALATKNDRLELCREMVCLISVLTPEHVASRLKLRRKGRGLNAQKLRKYIEKWKNNLGNRVIPVL